MDTAYGDARDEAEVTGARRRGRSCALISGVTYGDIGGGGGGGSFHHYKQDKEWGGKG